MQHLDNPSGHEETDSVIKTSELHLTASAKDIKKIPSDALVIAVAKGTDGPVLLENPLPAKAARALGDSLQVLGITGAADEVRRLPGLPETSADSLVLSGVGPVSADAEVPAETLRRAFHRHVGVAPSDYRDRFRSTKEQM